MARYKSTPEDFVVEEIPAELPQGDGEYLWIEIEKRLMTTAAVAEWLAEELGAAARDVTWAGRKDKVAVTRQWFSLPAAGRGLQPKDVEALDLSEGGKGLRVLQAARHPGKLRLGELLGNRFELRVREVDGASADRAAVRLDEILTRGLPNRFGKQRFGQRGDNAERGLELLRGGGGHIDRRQAFFLLSAAQAAVFNHLLEERPWDRLVEGDLVRVHATDELLQIGDPEPFAKRLECFELSPTGPLFGTKTRQPRGAARRFERAAMDAFDVPFVDRRTLPRGVRLFGARRSLRMAVDGLSWSFEGSEMRLEFELAPGSYASVLLEEIFPEGIQDVTEEVSRAADADMPAR